MSSRKTLILIAAIGVGIFAGIALLNYVRGIEDDVYEDAQPVDVLIATADIPEGTPAAEAVELVEVAQVPLKIRPATFIPPGNLDSIAGLVARNDIPRNQIIVSGLFVDPAVVSTSLRDQIPPGMVAFSLEVDNIRAVGGYLQPGDEVNVMVNHEDPYDGCDSGDEEGGEGEGETPPGGPTLQLGAGTQQTGFGAEVASDLLYCTYEQPARYLYQRVEILAIGARQQLQAGDDTSSSTLTPEGGIITLIVPNEAAQLLASVPSDSIYLTLLPDGYEAEPLPALNGSVLTSPTPAELAGCATPYGPDGFIEGDNAVVGETDDEFGEFVRGHCARLWTGGE